MPEIKEGYVIITQDEYADMIRNDTFLEMLTESMLYGAKLSWDKTHLEFNNEATCTLLRSYTSRYSNTYNLLMKEEEKKNESHSNQ